MFAEETKIKKTYLFYSGSVVRMISLLIWQTFPPEPSFFFSFPVQLRWGGEEGEEAAQERF